MQHSLELVRALLVLITIEQSLVLIKCSDQVKTTEVRTNPSSILEQTQNPTTAVESTASGRKIRASQFRQLSFIEPLIEDRAKQIENLNSNPNSRPNAPAERTQARGLYRGGGFPGGSYQTKTTGSDYRPNYKLQIGYAQPPAWPLPYAPVRSDYPHHQHQQNYVASQPSPYVPYRGVAHQEPPKQLISERVLELVQPSTKFYFTSLRKKYNKNRQDAIKTVVSFKGSEVDVEEIEPSRVIQPDFYVQEGVLPGFIRPQGKFKAENSSSQEPQKKEADDKKSDEKKEDEKLNEENDDKKGAADNKNDEKKEDEKVNEKEDSKDDGKKEAEKKEDEPNEDEPEAPTSEDDDGEAQSAPDVPKKGWPASEEPPREVMKDKKDAGRGSDEGETKLKELLGMLEEVSRKVASAKAGQDKVSGKEEAEAEMEAEPGEQEGSGLDGDRASAKIGAAPVSNLDVTKPEHEFETGKLGSSSSGPATVERAGPLGLEPVPDGGKKQEARQKDIGKAVFDKVFAKEAALGEVLQEVEKGRAEGLEGALLKKEEQKAIESEKKESSARNATPGTDATGVKVCTSIEDC